MLLLHHHAGLHDGGVVRGDEDAADAFVFQAFLLFALGAAFGGEEVFEAVALGVGGGCWVRFGGCD